MAEQTQQKHSRPHPETERERPAMRPPAKPVEEPLTHVLASSRRAAGFRRGGIRFDSTPNVYSLEGMSAEQIESIKNESMLSVQFITEREAAEWMRNHGDVTAAEMSPAEIASELHMLKRRVKQLETENEHLRMQLTGDRPPTTPGVIPGQ